jgi:hypothetical protein
MMRQVFKGMPQSIKRHEMYYGCLLTLQDGKNICTACMQRHTPCNYQYLQGFLDRSPETVNEVYQYHDF